MSAQDNFGIRKDYRSRTKALTYEATPGDYWNAARIQSANIYQHYVYRCAATILKAQPPGRRTAIDVGCGYPSKLMAMIAPFADRLAAIDQPTLIIDSSPIFAFKGADLEHPIEAEETYQVVICADVIEHLMNPDALLVTLGRFCADDGVIVLSTPDRDARRGPGCLRSNKREHVREWNKPEFLHYLQSRGFELLQHLSLPQRRVTMAEEIIASVGIRVPSYLASCQLAVCRPRSRQQGGSVACGKAIPGNTRVSMARLMLQRFAR